MSNKQIARAAVHGRKVTFRFLSTQPAHEVVGYVVGMDDYHWMVASVLPLAERSEDALVTTSLVHKSAQMITLGATDSFIQEDAAVQVMLSQIGGSFWQHCLDDILQINATIPTPQEQTP